MTDHDKEFNKWNKTHFEDKIFDKNTDTMQPWTDCHNRDINSSCEECYYFNRMNEFVDYI